MSATTTSSQSTAQTQSSSYEIENAETVAKTTLNATSKNAVKTAMDELPKGIEKGNKRMGTQCYHFANDSDDWIINKRTGKFVNFSNKLRHAAGESSSNIERTLPNGVREVGSFENRPVYANNSGQRWYFDEYGKFVEVNSTKPSSNGKPSKKITI